MILTTCAACAAPLAYDAPRCVRCATRYCNKTCQHDHWRRGHKQMCKKIHRGGNAEQFHADKKYKEAVAVAVEKCAEDTKGQTCFICTQALHWKTKEGLVRGCACRGTAGFAHVSCLAEQAKILVAEGEDRNLFAMNTQDQFWSRWKRWFNCSQCEQDYHGVVKCALGWACWKTNLGRPEGEYFRTLALLQLANGLQAGDRHEEALAVHHANLALSHRFGRTETMNIDIYINIANCFGKLGRDAEALEIEKKVYEIQKCEHGMRHRFTLDAALNYGTALFSCGNFSQAQTHLRRTIKDARRADSVDDDTMLQLNLMHARSLYEAPDAPWKDLEQAATILTSNGDRAKQVMGEKHPLTTQFFVNIFDLYTRMSARPESSAPSPAAFEEKVEEAD